MAKSIRITIKGGKVNKDFSGFIGTSCGDLDDKLRLENTEVEDESFKNGGATCEVDTETVDT